MLDASCHAGRILQGEGYDFACASLTEDGTPLFSVYRRARGASQ